MKSAKDQSSGLAFNGQGGAGYSRGTDASKEQVNHWSGHLNDGRLVNKGRGPTVGNKGTQKAKMPPTSSLPAFKPGKDMFTGTSQYRGAGGTTVKCPSNYDKQNVGRGPTKGNE